MARWRVAPAASEEPVLVEFIVTDAQAQQLLDLLEAEALHLLYAKLSTDYGVIGHSDLWLRRPTTRRCPLRVEGGHLHRRARFDRQNARYRQKSTFTNDPLTLPP